MREKKTRRVVSLAVEVKFCMERTVKGNAPPPKKKKKEEKHGDNEHRKAVKLTSEKMALQVLRVQVSLVTVRAREFAICVLSRDSGVLRTTVDSVRDGSGATRYTWENATAALRPHDLCAWWFLGTVRRAVGAIHVVAHSSPGLTVGVAESTGGHSIEVATVPWGGRGDGLRVSLRGRRGRQHTWRGRVGLVSL